MRRHFAIAASLTLASCGGSAALPPRPGDRAITPIAEVSAKLDVRRIADRPSLTAVAREGDPVAAIGAVLLVDEAASGAAPGLAAVLEDRLRERGAVVRVVRGAIVVTLDAVGGTGPTLRALSTALGAQVVASPHLGRRAAELAGPTSPRGLEAAARCAGAPIGPEGAATADVTTPVGAASIESLRREVATVERTSLAVVGDARAVEQASAELEGGPAWAAGAPVRLAPAAERGVALVQRAEGPSARGDDGGDVVISVALPVAARAPSLAAAFGDPASPAAVRLSLLAPRFWVAGASGVARPGGGGSCLRVDLRARRPDRLDADAVGGATRIVRDAAAASAPIAERGAAARAIVTAGDARDAAARAAWWTTTSDDDARATPSTFVAVDPEGERAARVGSDDVAAAIERAAKLGARPPIERRARIEHGQGAFVMAVGTSCPAVLDTRTTGDGAVLALGLVGAARASSDDGVELAPFVSTEGAGLVGRATPRPGEDGGALADRVARALASALGGRPPALGEIERARARLLEGAARTWGHHEVSEALIQAIAPDRPFAIAPFGIEPALVRAEAAAAAQAPADVLAGPLRVAVLANVDAAQVERAAAVFEARLPPSPAPACPSSPATPGATGGRVDVRVAGDERFSQLAWATGPMSEEAAEIAVALLEPADGAIVRAAESVGARVDVHRLGAEVLIDLRVAPERTEDAFLAVNAALDGLARGEVVPAAASRAAEAARTRLRARAADPIARAITLWREGGIVAPTPPDPRSIAPRLGASSWVTVVARPS